MRREILAFSLTIMALTLPVFGQAPGDDLSKDFDLAEGLEVRLWAVTPQFLNPTSMDVDAQGRIWVTEAVNYRDFRNDPSDRLAAPKGDRVRVLADSDGDGVCDSATVFVQDEDLVAPLGIAVIGPKVYVSCSPRLIVYTDTDGDLRADEKEILLEGFGGFDHDHGLHSVVAGPDGRLWFNVGNAGPHVVSDRSGWTLRSGSIYDDGGPSPAGNVPGLVSDDGRTWVGGLALSMERDGSDLRVHGHNFRNSYEIAVDAWGDVWQNDNDDDGNESCRIARVPRGANMGYFSADGTRTWRADRRPGQTTQDAHWHRDDPGVFPSGEVTGAGAPTGLFCYETGALGPALENSLLSCDAGRGLVFAARPRFAGGAEPTWTSTILMKPADPEQKWFRPSDVVVGMDGAIYVADWWDPVVGGHLMRDEAGVGRIYRIARKGAPTAPISFELETVAGAVAALGHPVAGVRDLARERLSGSGPAVVAALAKTLAGSASESVQARALFLLAATAEGRRACLAALDRSSPRLRLAAFRALVEGGVPVLELAPKLAQDPHPAVRAELALHLRDLPWEDCKAIVLELYEGFDGADRGYLEALGLACDGKEDLAYAEIAAAHADQPLKWSPAFAALAWRLHPPAAVPALAVRALAPTLDAAERRRAIDALGFIPTPEASSAMAAIVTGGPEDLRPLARFWLERNDSGPWKGHGALARIGARRPEDAEALWSSGVMTGGTKAGAIDLTGMSDLWLEVTDAGDGNSCDWADWIEPTLLGPDGPVPLTSLAWNRADAQWGGVNRDRNCAGQPMKIDGELIESGIGTHARSEIHYSLPPDRYRELRFRVGPDDGGTRQGIGATSVEFKVFAAARAQRARHEAELARLLDESAPARERRRIAKTLAADAAGGLELIALAAKDSLPEDLRATVTEVIHRNPDFSVRALAGKWFPRSDGEGQVLPPPEDLLALDGDVDRGRALFFGDRAGCSKCHAHDGRGADVGPDLSAIHGKYARAQLLDAVLNPSAAIAFGYEGWMIETRNSGTHTGFLLADGPLVILKDTAGRRTTIRREDVTFRHKLTLSTMPDNIALGMTPQELMDIVAFLGRDWSTEPRFGDAVTLFNGEDLEGWVAFAGSGDAAGTWTVRDGILECRGTPIGYLRTEADYLDFELELEWSFDPARGPGNSGVLLRMVGPDKVWPKSIEAQLMHRNAGDIWNIDDVSMVVAPERTEGRRTAKLQPSNELPLGHWNRYRIRLHGGRLTLEVNGVVQNRAWDCEHVPGKILLQSEGAAIRFRNIRLRPILD